MVNKVILIGNLGRDPEVRSTPSGQPVATFTLATSRRWKDKNGQRQEQTEWHQIVVWGKQGENCGKYLKKGRPVFVEGRLQTRSWEDQSGNKRYTTEVVAQAVQFLGGRSEGSGDDAGWESRGSQSNFSDESPDVTVPSSSTSDDDLPF